MSLVWPVPGTVDRTEESDVARRKSTDNDPGPEGVWIAPGPGTARTAKEFMDGVGDQTQEEYEAEIAAGGGKSRSWAKVFDRQIAAMRRKQEG